MAVLAGYGALASFAFGVAMNLSFWPFAVGTGTGLSFVPGGGLGTNLHRLLLFSVATSLGWDLGRALTTAVGVALVGGPVLVLLRRTATRACVRPSVVTATRRDRHATGVHMIRDGGSSRHLESRRPRHLRIRPRARSDDGPTVG